MYRKLTMDEVRRRVSEAYTMLRITKGGIDQLAKKLNPLREELGSRTPSGRRRYSLFMAGYAAGLSDAEFNRIMQNEVEFVYRNPETGVIHSTHLGSKHLSLEPFYDNGTSRLLDGFETAHVWKGTDKAFNGWESPYNTRRNAA